MRWKDVFFIWLWADILLAAGTLTMVLISPGGITRDTELLLFVLFYGFLITLPSLAAMLLFHALYSHFKSNRAYRFMPYLLLVLFINLVYWLSGRFAHFFVDSFSSLLILCTTIAGLISLAFVHWRVKKRTKQVIAGDPAL